MNALSYEEKLQSETDRWLEENPDFKKENDPDDTKWDRIHGYVSRMFVKPQSPKDIREVLDIARERLFGKKATLPEKSLHSIAAQKEKLAASSKSASGSGAVSKAPVKTGKIDSSLKEYLQGFSDEELQEIAS